MHLAFGGLQLKNENGNLLGTWKTIRNISKGNGLRRASPKHLPGTSATDSRPGTLLTEVRGMVWY